MSDGMRTECVWDYPRPQQVEDMAQRIRVMQGGVVQGAVGTRGW